MKHIIKNALIVLLTAILLPISVVRVASKSLAGEVKAFTDGFISQQRLAQVQVEESIIVKAPAEPKPIEEIKIVPAVVEKVAEPVVAVSNDITYMKQRICEVFGNQCANALIIAEHESHFNTFAVSKTNDYGVFQLNCRWQGRRVGGNCNRFFDFETNLRVAKQIYDEQGWNPWSTKIYLKH